MRDLAQGLDAQDVSRLDGSEGQNKSISTGPQGRPYPSILDTTSLEINRIPKTAGLEKSRWPRNIRGGVDPQHAAIRQLPS